MFSYIVKTLEDVKRNPIVDPKPYLTRYLDWMEKQVKAYYLNQLPNSKADWRLRIQNEHETELLANQIVTCNAQGKVFVTIGRQLSSIVRGTSDPLEILFGDGLAEAHYQEICDEMHCCSKIKGYLDILAHKNNKMRILEVGAGIGSMTSHVLAPMLLHGEVEKGSVRFLRYDYTDISESFLEKAQQKFSYGKHNMGFKVLDIEKNPISQGFEEASYDLVVAFCVVHATKNLAISLTNIRKLLKPGGQLLLLEITRPDVLRSNFVYGTLPGWWQGTEDYRQLGPCVTEEQWNKELLLTGFSGVDFALPDFQSQSCQELSLMLSTAVTKMKASQSERKYTVLVDSDSQLQANMAERICRGLRSFGNPDCEVVPISSLTDDNVSSSALYIFLPETQRCFLHNIEPASFKWLQAFLSSARYLLWVKYAENVFPLMPQMDMVTGLARVLRSENSNLSFITLTCEEQNIDNQVESIIKVLQANQFESSDQCETEYFGRDGIIWINRIVEADYLNQQLHKKSEPQLSVQEFGNGPPLVMSIVTPGLLDTLQFTEDPIFEAELQAHDIEIEVKSIGVNFRDLLVILGKSNEETIGCECAGVVRRLGSACTEFRPGDRVCAAIIGCARSYARCNSLLASKIPDSLDYTEGAALPITGVTAYHALLQMAQLKKGESILITSGSGGTGQMAIQIAQSIGAEVFVTVGYKNKKELLMDLYQIAEDHIFYSRDESFASGILRLTNGRGVDVILNSLSGKALLASWSVIAPFGRFVEIGKADINANSKLPMAWFAKTVSFFSLAVDYMITHRPLLIQKSLSTVLELLATKTLKIASPLHVYPISRVEEAFRYLQSGKNTGKIVLTLGLADLVSVSLVI